MTAPLLVPGGYTPGPLTDDLLRLSEPRTPLTPADLLTIVGKYAHAFVHSGSQDQSVSLAELTRFLDQFVNRRRGADSLEGRGELRKRMLDHGFALCMLLDLPKTAHILWDICHREPPAPENPDTEFFGLDIGAGTGVLMLGMWLAARRAGFANCRIVGLERNEMVAVRTGELLAELGIGRVLIADAKRPGLFKGLCPEHIHFVANETLPSQGHRLWKEDFPVINERLFEQCGQALNDTLFFPSAVHVVDSRGGRSLRLSPQTRFLPESDYPPRLLRMAGIELNGQPTLLEDVGRDWHKYIAPEWLPLLPHRW